MQFVGIIIENNSNDWIALGKDKNGARLLYSGTGVGQGTKHSVKDCDNMEIKLVRDRQGFQAF